MARGGGISGANLLFGSRTPASPKTPIQTPQEVEAEVIARKLEISRNKHIQNGGTIEYVAWQEAVHWKNHLGELERADGPALVYDDGRKEWY